jgi:hypothetical protein
MAVPKNNAITIMQQLLLLDADGGGYYTTICGGVTVQEIEPKIQPEMQNIISCQAEQGRAQVRPTYPSGCRDPKRLLPPQAVPSKSLQNPLRTSPAHKSRWL